MPFTPYKDALDPEAMNAALEAFDSAWSEIDSAPVGHEKNLTRDVIAKRIIEAAMKNGERDPERLKAYALGVDQRRSA